MSGSNNEIVNNDAPASSAEPSMEEILASIRRILKDDQNPQGEAEPEEILVLDSSMVVKPGSVFNPVEPPAPETAFEFTSTTPIADELEPVSPGIHATPETDFSPDAEFDLPLTGRDEMQAGNPAETAAENDVMEERIMSDDTQENVQSPDGLVGEAASNAAAGSIGALIRSISSDRQIAVGRAGVTLEDLVREELRPLLKSWLDSNLPALVERIVRAEIQRVIERSSI